MENDIIPELPKSNTECRFCNKTFCRIDNLNRHLSSCKERKEYHRILIKEKDKKVINIETQNNYTNCHIGNNNNFILNFGQTTDNTKIEEIIDCLRLIVKEYNNDPEQVYLMAGELINKYDKLLMKTPENNNVIIPYSKCLYAEVKIPEGWEKEPIDSTLNRSFKDRATRITQKKESINTENDKVFKSKTNEQIFSEVKQFAKKGFNHSYRGEELRKIKTNYKINKLKNKKYVVVF